MPPLTGDDYHNPTLDGPRPTRAVPSGGTFSAYASTHIAAPPRLVYDTLLDTSTWPRWNTFVPSVEITSQPADVDESDRHRLHLGTQTVFHARVTPPTVNASRLRVTELEPLQTGAGAVTRVAWRLDNAAVHLPEWVLTSSRLHEIEDGGDGTTWVRTVEPFCGLVARVVRWKVGGALRERFQDWVADLRGWCERGKGREGGGNGDGDGDGGVGEQA